MFARLFLPFLFAFTFTSSCAQTIDTIRCGNYYGYGKTVNGKKEGPWKYFYADSRNSFADGSYYSGMKTGEWKFYFNYSGQKPSVKHVLHYSQNVPDGAASFFYADNRPYAKGQYTKGYADGKWEFYGSNEKQSVTVHYFTMGKPTGNWICASGGDRMYWTGEMKATGGFGRWVQLQNGTQVGTGLYVNGKREGSWMEFKDNFIYEEGNYQSGEKEGCWVTADIDEGKIESQVFHHGVLDGPDSVFKQGLLSEVTLYKNGHPDGAYESYDENGNLKAKGTFQTNPELIAVEACSGRKYPFSVSEIFLIDFIEAGLADKNGILFSDEYETSVLHRDTMLRKIRNSSFIPDTCNDHTYPLWECRKTGNWSYYYPNGKLKCEGSYSSTYKDSISWDSTLQVEDPNNAGTYIMAPLKTEYMLFPFEGWWKIYNEKGILVKEERYEFGVLKETKKL